MTDAERELAVQSLAVLLESCGTAEHILLPTGKSRHDRRSFPTASLFPEIA
jgi:hypothetical protein